MASLARAAARQVLPAPLALADRLVQAVVLLEQPDHLVQPDLLADLPGILAPLAPPALLVLRAQRLLDQPATPDHLVGLLVLLEQLARLERPAPLPARPAQSELPERQVRLESPARPRLPIHRLPA